MISCWGQHKFAKMDCFWKFKEHKSGKKKGNKTNEPTFFISFLSSNCLWYLLLYWPKFIFMWSPLWSVLVCKISVGEGCENRIWSHSIQETCTLRKVKNHIKESNKTCVTFSIELWSKFVWSHGLLIWIETYFLWGFWSRLFFSGESFPQRYISHKWEW